MTIIAGPLPTPAAPDKKITPAVDRRARYSQLSPGLLVPGDGSVTQTGTPGMSVLVNAIAGCLIDDGITFGAGKYWFESDAQVTVGPLAASDPGNPRIDLIVAKVLDTDAGDGSLGGQFAVVTGTPAASPSVPATPARCEALYRVAVAAGATSIVNANLTDVRRYATVTPRVGCRLHKAGSSVLEVAATAISWADEDEDTDGFWSSGSTVTIPAGKGGVYAISFRTEGAFSGGRAFIEVAVTSSLAHMPTDYRQPMEPIEDRGLITVVTPLAAGDSFTSRVYHTSGATVTFESWLSCYRVGP